MPSKFRKKYRTGRTRTQESTPKLPPLAPGELATRLRLIPPIVPVADGHRTHKPKPFFAACAATPCNGPTEKYVFMAYAALAGPTGATWAIKRNRVWFFARQEKVVEIAGCCMKTVQRMTFRLVKSGRLRCVQSGRGRLPHAMMVVPEGWDSQSRGDTESPLRSVEATQSRHNRAFTKRRAADATRLVEEETSSPVTQPPLASRAAEAVPAKKPGPLFVVATPSQAQPHIDAMLELIERSKAKVTSPIESSTFNLDPDTEARMAEQDRRHHAGEKGVALSLDTPTPSRGGVQKCGHDRMMGGSCHECGYDDGTGFTPSADQNQGV